MSDQSSPPKPKPGSLRDRIAAFENKGSPSQGPPIPRPKPGAVQWKPRPPSPPSPEVPQPERKPASTGTMSTSDAIESIRGGSLKERMAALQGKGAFGGPPPPIAPKPNVERPKWKPPPVVPAPATSDEPREVAASVEAGARDASRSPPPRAPTSPSPETQGTSNREGDPVSQTGDGADLDPAEDERQRRAAIAARMARLGGARFGMGPPIFAPKPVVRKADPTPSASDKEDRQADQPSLESGQVLETLPPHDLPATASPVPESGTETERKDEHELHASVIPRAPSSMPVPAGPRRAAPPRKKASKNAPSSALPEPPVEEAEDVTSSATGEPLPSADHTHDAPRDPQEIAEAVVIVDATTDERSIISDDAEHPITQPPASIEAPQEHERHDVEAATLVVEASTHAAAVDQQSERPPEMDQQEDEETRRQHVAARLAQMGAFNPLAGPPPVPRRASTDEPASVRSEEPLDVEEEVYEDTEEYGETIPPPPTDPTRLVEAQPVKDDAAETEQDNKLEDAQISAHRDGGYVVASYIEEQPIKRNVANVVAEQAQGTALEVLDTPGTDAQTSGRVDVCSAAEQENETKDVVENAPPPVAARPTIPPPVNLRSKPTPPSSPSLSPPPKTPFQAFKIDEEPPASPDMPPRPIPPPGRSGSVTEDLPSPPPRRSTPPPPRRTSVRVAEALVEPSSPPPVPTSSRPVSRRPDTPPIITTLAQEPTARTHERERGEEEEPTARPEGDEAAARRHAIANRMARLGGIRFDGPPPMNPLSRPPLPAAPPPTSIPPDELEPEEREEGDEETRKQRIAARLAGMGVIRLGMLLPGTPVGRASREDESEDAVPVPVPAPQRSASTRKPPPAVPADITLTAEPESQSRGTEGGEAEEVRYSDVEGPLSSEEEDVLGSLRSPEVLHTLPPRVSRSPPPGRPPVPTIPATMLGRRPSVATSSSRQTSLDDTNETPRSPSGFVMVEAEGEEKVSPPRRLSTRVARSTALPPPPPPSAVDPPEALSLSMVGAQWDLPVIPQGQEGEEVASTGWSEDSTAVYAPPTVSSAPSSRRASAKALSASMSGSMSASGSGFGSGSGLVTRDQPQMTTEELVAVSDRVGGRVVEAATALFEKSKRMLVGDGSYAGFVRTALGQAGFALSQSDEWGHVVYVQAGNAVQRRISDILPGDVISFWDAKLKGHKGLQPYSRTAGAGEAPLVGIVSAFDVKKSKVRVWQANQHVGQQTVENVSYRLEDLKAGVVKVYRVLDA